jgi:hypothetical protein
MKQLQLFVSDMRHGISPFRFKSELRMQYYSPLFCFVECGHLHIPGFLNSFSRRISWPRNGISHIECFQSEISCIHFVSTKPHVPLDFRVRRPLLLVFEWNFTLAYKFSVSVWFLFRYVVLSNSIYSIHRKLRAKNLSGLSEVHSACVSHMSRVLGWS